MLRSIGKQSGESVESVRKKTDSFVSKSRRYSRRTKQLRESLFVYLMFHSPYKRDHVWAASENRRFSSIFFANRHTGVQECSLLQNLMDEQHVIWNYIGASSRLSS